MREKLISFVIWLAIFFSFVAFFKGIAEQEARREQEFERNFNGGIIVKHEVEPEHTEQYDDCSYMMVGVPPTTTMVPVCSTEEEVVPAKYYVSVKGKDGMVERFEVSKEYYDTHSDGTTVQISGYNIIE